MLNIKENMLHAFVFVQIAFAVLAVLALAFAQAIGASIGIMNVLAVFGGCILVEMFVFTGIFAYMRIAGRDYVGTLSDAAHAVKSTGKYVTDTTGDAVDAIKSAAETSRKQSSSTEIVDAKVDENGVRVVIEEPSAGDSDSDDNTNVTSAESKDNNTQAKINNAKHVRKNDEEQ